MHRGGKPVGFIASIVLPLGIICLFAFSSFALALFGGGVYRSVSKQIEDDFGATVASNYLRTKISQNNIAGAVSLRQQDELEILVIASTILEYNYETRIIVFEGHLMESFTEASKEFDLADYVSIATVEACDFKISDEGLFTAQIQSTAGKSTRVVLALVTGDGS